MPSQANLFYALRTNFKRFSLLAAMAVWLGACGSAGGINLPAPVADLEGGTIHEAKVCAVIQGAPTGAFVRVRNISDSTITDVDSDLAADGSFSVQQCVKVGQTLELQIFDNSGGEISGVQQLTRSGTETNTCPTPTNAAPTCP